MYNLAADAKKTMHLAKLNALNSACASVEPAHVFQALLDDEQEIRDLLAPAKKALATSLKLLGKQPTASSLHTYAGEMQKLVDLNITLSPCVTELCVRARGLANRWKHQYVGNVHLLHSLVGMECIELSEILTDFGLDPYVILAQCLVILKRLPPSDEQRFFHGPASSDVQQFSQAWRPESSKGTEEPQPTEVWKNPWKLPRPPQFFTANSKEQGTLEPSPHESPKPPESFAPTETFAQPSDWMSETVLDTISSAMDRANLHATSIHPDHLLQALLNEPTGMIRRCLEPCVGVKRLESELIDSLEHTEFPIDNQLFSRQTMTIVTKARAFAAQGGRKHIETEDLFLSLLESAVKAECDCVLKRAEHLGKIKGHYSSLMEESKSSFGSSSTQAAQRTSCVISGRVSYLVLQLLNRAKDVAKLEGRIEITNLHLLKAWLQSTEIAEQSLAMMRDSVLEELNRLSEEVSKECLAGQSVRIDTTFGVTPAGAELDPKFSDEAKATLSLTFDEARTIGDQLIQPNHILLSMLSQNITVIDDLLKSRGSLTTQTFNKESSSFSNIGLAYSTKEVLRRRLKWCSQWHKEAWRRTFPDSAPVLDLEIGDIDSIVEKERWPRSDQEPEHICALSPASKDLLAKALKESTKGGCSEIGVEHVAIALAMNVSGISGAVASEVLLDLNACSCWPNGPSVDPTVLPRGGKRARFQKLSSKAHQLLKQAWWHAQSLGSRQVNPEHILLAIATECDGISFVACQILDVDGLALYDALMHRLQAKSA